MRFFGRVVATLLALFVMFGVSATMASADPYPPTCCGGGGNTPVPPPTTLVPVPPAGSVLNAGSSTPVSSAGSGNLAFTGAAVMGMGALAIVLLAGGTALLLLGRPRRSS